ncbi:tumor necrosis factor receptor superfamily member 1B [Gadus macrocephalus]|uniref:tumor necrosis factor receptor superfamily member 1B n=1 Tax=Gadus macrocephalus TaxID=80720 RepID=UPI0028CBBB8D|nr:tumor necrosis factor receptor superfamily member 1B [Gadus macrocephalus]
MRGAATLVAVLLSATTYQVDSKVPYQLTSSKQCNNVKEEYRAPISMADWCCSRCPPGTMLKVSCNETADSVCEPCPSGQFMEKWNYKSSCFSCHECREDAGLQYSQKCTTSKGSKCVCQPGWYCDTGFVEPYCAGCEKYTLCELGWGVSEQGTADSDANCSPCPEGKYSDVVSHTESCKPHTRCQKAVVKQGTAISDTECDPTTSVYSKTPQSHSTEKQSNVVDTTASIVEYTTSGLFKSSIPMKTDSTLTPIQSSLPATKTPASTGVKLVTIVIRSVISCVLLVIVLVILVILVLWQSKIINRRGSQKHTMLTDTNGNSEMVESMHRKNALGAQITSMAAESHELQALMDTQEPCTGHSNAPDKPFAGRKDPHVIKCDSLV